MNHNRMPGTRSLWKNPKALIALIVLPLVAAGIGLWALQGRVSAVDKVPAAVVNLDTGTHMTIDGKDTFVPFGRQLTGALTQPATVKDDQIAQSVKLDWILTDANKAKEGLDNGTYSAVITIPKDFSAKLATLGTPQAKKASISVVTNDANSPLAGLIGRQIAQAAADGTGSQLTQQYMKGIYIGFSSIKNNLTDAAAGAHQLQRGAQSLDQGMQKTSHGAQKLASGADQLAGGTVQLNHGLAQSADGSSRLSVGLTDLVAGLNTLDSGIHSTAGGAENLAHGADQLAAGTSALHAGLAGTENSPGLASAAELLDQQLAGDGTAKNPGLVHATQNLADGTAKLRDGVDHINTAINGDQDSGKPGLASGAQNVAQGTRGITKQAEGLRTVLDGTPGSPRNPGLTNLTKQLIARCQAPGADPVLCDGIKNGVAKYVGTLDKMVGTENSQGLLSLATTVDTGAQKVATGVTTVGGALSAEPSSPGSQGQPGLLQGAQQVADGAKQLAGTAPALTTGVHGIAEGTRAIEKASSALSHGASKLADGTKALSAGTAQLGDGSQRLAQGAREVPGGVRALHDGTVKLQAGSQHLVSGSHELADGTRTLADGTEQLTQGSHKLANGSGELAGGLTDGANKVPEYTPEQQQRMSSVVAEPVSTVATTHNAASSDATATAPFVIALALWLGLFGVFLFVPAVSRRLLDRALPMWLVVLRSLVPAVLIGLGQGILVGGSVALLGARPAFPLVTGVMMAAGVIAFACVIQALLAVFGSRTGRVVALILLVVQAVMLTGILPIQTAPDALQAIANRLPLTILSSGLVHAGLGGQVGSSPRVVIELLVWAIGALVVTLIASRRIRMHKIPIQPKADAVTAVGSQ
ncbi:YhgE/Pip domain-containing protein [Devriesea agamarum]|uniref:YhgE/Pip domain-containing protein n=1 Tax=Devriesea agamarum TaxID=472569 RepID=UPI00071D00C3|nr:YhgE/Pip domain-containing protein [Devriesea agamarum]